MEVDEVCAPADIPGNTNHKCPGFGSKRGQGKNHDSSDSLHVSTIQFLPTCSLELKT